MSSLSTHHPRLVSLTLKIATTSIHYLREQRRPTVEDTADGAFRSKGHIQCQNLSSIRFGIRTPDSDQGFPIPPKDALRLPTALTPPWWPETTNELESSRSRRSRRHLDDAREAARRIEWSQTSRGMKSHVVTAISIHTQTRSSVEVGRLAEPS